MTTNLNLESYEAQIWKLTTERNRIEVTLATSKARDTLRRKLHRWRKALADEFGSSGPIAEAFGIPRMLEYSITTKGERSLVITRTENVRDILIVDLDTGQEINV